MTMPKGSSLEVSIEEVYSATNYLNESNFIGEGTAGRVYRGILSNNQEVAIKHIIHEECIETFLREVRSLTNVRHPNLVALLGYSKNAKECFLIYEICPNGNLSQWLFADDRVLSWIQRLEIAIDSAKGLLFLHTYHEGSLIHRDIKVENGYEFTSLDIPEINCFVLTPQPTNILLSQNFEAKLSDFGLSKVLDIDESYMISEVRATYGYVGPEYETNHHVNSAGDVYSFGIVLLQIISGRKVINMDMDQPTRLDKIAKSLMRERRAMEFVDPKLHGDYSSNAFQLTLELAISCIAPKQQRPSSEKVVDKLEKALAITRREKTSTPHSTPVCGFHTLGTM
ncbi:probable serine/threonine-protein kinase At1g01540 isoform X1 [Capsicum annuum]|nr:probable serine/threonine-protein kinase At1g01540 isoform X1 [Capsicum annuum]